MNNEELFERLPKLLFSCFRNQMLLGSIPAQTVQRVLDPLLSNFYELMLQLPPHLQTEFENILRIYPDVAESFGVRIKPPIAESLRRFAQYRLKAAPGDSANDMGFDIAAEPQQQMELPDNSSVQEGQGFFATDKGNSVYLEFLYSAEDDCVSFEYKPPRLEVEIHICGVYTVTLSDTKPRHKVPADSLFDILIKCVRGVDIKIREPFNAGK